MTLKKLIPVDIRDILIDVPVPYSIYDNDGRLLLRSGLVVRNPKHLDALLAVGMKEDETAEAEGGEMKSASSSFERMEQIAQRLSVVYQHIRIYQRFQEYQDGSNDILLHSIQDLAQAVLACTEKDSDAAFAMPHLDRHHGYEVVHHLMAAVVCARMAKALKWNQARRESLVAAVLTQDIALLPLRSVLESQKNLDDALQQQIKRHTEDGVLWLKRIGVKDEVWLNCVQQHHEAMDGAGYPQGLDGRSICIEARIASLADAFSAMLRPRPYRGRVLAKMALADLYANPQGRYDPALISGLIRELGIFPPGSIVGLINGEMGIVTRSRAGTLNAPLVSVLIDAKGRELYKACPRDVSDPLYAIDHLKEPESCHRIWKKLSLLWDTTILHEEDAVLQDEGITGGDASGPDLPAREAGSKEATATMGVAAGSPAFMQFQAALSAI